MVSVHKMHRVILPALNIKELKPVAPLISPRELVVVMSLTVILAQIADNFKGILSSKEVQKLPSVKLYSKVISVGLTSLNLSSVYSISKTLGPELETLSILSVQERLNFLNSIKKTILLERVFNVGKVFYSSKIFSDPIELLKYRRALSLQCRSLLIATPIYLTNNLSLGVSINEVDIEMVLDSCRLIWIYWGLEEEEFNFLLLKSSYCFQSVNPLLWKKSFNLNDCVRLLVYIEFRNLFAIENKLSFSDDFAVLKSDNNLTLMENNLGFIERLLPKFSFDMVVSPTDLEDILIRTAFDQKKLQTLKMNNTFNSYKGIYNNDKKTLGYLKNIGMKNIK